MPLSEFKRFFLIILLLSFATKIAIGQSDVEEIIASNEQALSIDENKIEKLAFKILNSDNEDERLIYNEELKDFLKNELSKENSFRFPFTSVNSISIITSPDSLFRIFNWNIPLNDGSYTYECGIQKRDLATEETDFFYLIPVPDSLETESYISENNQWIGGLFYDIKKNKTDFQTYYTLLTWDGNNLLTNKKRIEVLWFDQTNAIRFGAPIFTKDGKKSNRVIFEFSAQNTMKLKFDELNNRIVFDHLTPSNSNLKGVYEYYGADLSYDSFYWKENKWIYHPDIDLDSGLKKEKKKYQKAMKKEKEELIMNGDSLIKYAPTPR